MHAVRVHDGAVVDVRGDAELVTFMRSAAKPLQALPLVAAVPDLPLAERAIACASHEGLPEQIAAAAALLARARAREDELACGAAVGNRLGHNCSGKQAGMLLVCRVRGWPLDGFWSAAHPLQRELRDLVAEAAGVVGDDMATGVDGCGVVTYALPIARIAVAFEALATGRLDGADHVVVAMTRHPELVGGPDAVDTRLMRARPGAVAKRGAEGVLCGALDDGSAFTLKVADGASRAYGPAAGAFLHIPELATAPLLNSRNERIGTIQADF